MFTSIRNVLCILFSKSSLIFFLYYYKQVGIHCNEYYNIVDGPVFCLLFDIDNSK